MKFSINAVTITVLITTNTVVELVLASTLNLA
ncbi:hypothetical protein ACJ72_06469 [Emergomyces africanus]|uniref:Uncharacterized protein n=1 Tax=Emergomyces africanus TaxID=1955775 RepID=A0A1B7NQW4_9EURO|nr:hypothetical protein ACJ72_06469 [Emergomyces africanus]